jgi:ubiquinone biosynthesis protein UbiJ
MRLVSLPAAVILDKLLEGEPWARARLAPFAGETIEFTAASAPPLRLAIRDGGRIAPGDAAPTLSFRLREGALATLASAAPNAAGGEDRLMRAFDVEGNARLASEILLLARHLRWDAEEDLSRVFGDVLAHRMAGAARTIASWHLEAARRLAGNLVEYAIEERRLLVPQGEFEAFAAGVAQLRDRIARLAKRLESAGTGSRGR